MKCQEFGFSIKAGSSKGRVAPQWYLDQPLIDAGEARYMGAFWVLNTCRPRGGDFIGPIPWLAMRAYADHYGLTPEVAEDLFTVIGGLDRAYMAYEIDRLKRARENA